MSLNNDNNWNRKQKLHIIFCCLIFMNETMILISIFSYIADIVIDFNLVKDKTDVGFYTGIPTLCYRLGQASTTFIWSTISDKVGRKPILIFSQVVLFVGGFLISYSTNFIYFCVVFVVMGMLAGGAIPVIKTSIGEITPKKYLSFVMSFYIGMFPLGVLIGSPITGFLVRPTKQYPSIFASNKGLYHTKDFFDKYPIILCNLILALVIGLCCIGSWIFIYETKVDKLEIDVVKLEIDVNVDKSSIKKSESDENSKSDQKDDNTIELQTIEVKEEEDKSSMNIKDNQERVKSYSTIENRIRNKIEKNDFITLVTLQRNDLFFFIKTKLNSVLKNEIFSCISISTTLIYLLLGFFDFLLGRATPTFYSLPVEDKGLGFRNWEIGIMENLGGVFGVLIVLSGIVSWIIGKLSPVWCCRICTLIVIPFIPFLPELSYLKAEYEFLTWILLIISVFAKIFLFTVVYSSIMVMSQNSVHQKYRARLQGIQYVFVSIARAMGPYVGNVFLSISSRVNSFPFDIHFFFIIGCIGLVIITFYSFFIPTHLKNSRELMDKLKEDEKK